MFGVNLFFIELRTLEFLIRRVFGAISYNFSGTIRLKRIKDTKPAFTEAEFQKVIENQSTLIKESSAIKIASPENSHPPSREENEEIGINLLEDMLNLT